MAGSRRFSYFFYSVATLSLLGIFLVQHAAQAATYSYQRASQLVVGQNIEKFSLFGGKFLGGATITAADLDGNGQDEFIAGAGSGGGPRVEVLWQGSAPRTGFFVFDGKMSGGVSVAAGDVDGDGIGEIAVGPLSNFSSTIEIRKGNGQLIRRFRAFESEFRGGVRVAIAPAFHGYPGRIVVASGSGREQEIRVFDMFGKKTLTFKLNDGKLSSGLSVAAGWSDQWQQPVVVTGAAPGHKPLVLVYSLVDKKLLSSWLAYDSAVTSGVEVALRNDVVVTGPQSLGGPEVRQFTIQGKNPQAFFAFEKKFRAGIRVGASSQAGGIVPLVVPSSKTLLEVTGKQILIDLSEQQLRMVEKGKVVSTRRVSTGKWSTPTPLGKFKTHNKVTVAYSRSYGLYMEYWMAITPDGMFGVHALPYWKLKNGGKRYEGASHIGTPVSHGCIRQTVAEAKSLYAWAPVGTPVIITK